MNTFFGVGTFTVRLCTESGDEEGVGGAGDYDIAMGLDELPRLLITMERDLREGEKRGSQLRERYFFFIIRFLFLRLRRGRRCYWIQDFERCLAGFFILLGLVTCPNGNGWRVWFWGYILTWRE
jgi:hypothetical protein